MTVFFFRVTYAINFTTGGRGFISAYFPEYVKAKLSAGIIFKMLREDSKINGLSLQGVRLVSFTPSFFHLS